MRADRLVALLLLLQTRGRMTAHALADRLEVSDRTVYRDLAALGQAGVPIVTEPGPGGGCWLLDDYRTTLTGLSAAELEALFPAHAAAPLSALGLARARQDAYLKLAAALPDGFRNRAAFTADRILLDARSWFAPHEDVPYLGMLYQALQQASWVRIHYRDSTNRETVREVDPYGLVAKAATWYLVAANGANRDRIRVYRVSRVRRAEVLARSSTRPATFDLAAFWDTWSTTFEARVTPYVARLRLSPEAEEVLPELLGEGARALLDAPRVLDEATGWRVLSVPFDSFAHARTFALGMGPLAEVLEPPDLRRSVGEVALHLVRTYRPGPAEEPAF